MKRNLTPDKYLFLRYVLYLSRTIVNRGHCRISYGDGLGMSPCIMGLTTEDPYIQQEHTELYKILKFRVNWANIEHDTTIQKLQNLQRNDYV